jgi:hypothetical protein
VYYIGQQITFNKGAESMSENDGGCQNGLPPQLKSLLALWLDKCAHGEPPREGDFTADELGPWRDHLALAEYDGSARFRFRCCGAALAGRLGCDATGVFADALAGDVAPELIDTFKCVIALALPLVAHPCLQSGGHHTRYVDLVMPLQGETGRVNRLLLGSCETA